MTRVHLSIYSVIGETTKGAQQARQRTVRGAQNMYVVRCLPGPLATDIAVTILEKVRTANRKPNELSDVDECAQGDVP